MDQKDAENSRRTAKTKTSFRSLETEYQRCFTVTALNPQSNNDNVKVDIQCHVSIPSTGTLHHGKEL